MLYRSQGGATPGLRNPNVGDINVRNLSHVTSAIVAPFFTQIDLLCMTLVPTHVCS